VRRAFAIAVAGVLAMLLQTAIFPVLVPAGLAPNLLLVLVVYLGVHQFGAWGVLGAFVLGYFLDTFSGTLLGLHAFAFTALYLAVHHLARLLWTEGGLPAMLIVFAAACAHGLIALAWMSLVTAAGASVWQHALRQGLLGAAVAAAVTPAVFGFVSWERRLLGGS
jgi:rod shape-determining protein MreD